MRDETHRVRITSFETTTKTSESWCVLSHREGMRLDIALMEREAQVNRWIDKHGAIVVLVQHLNRDSRSGSEDGRGEGVGHDDYQGDAFNHLAVQLHLHK